MLNWLNPSEADFTHRFRAVLCDNALSGRRAKAQRLMMTDDGMSRASQPICSNSGTVSSSAG